MASHCSTYCIVGVFVIKVIATFPHSSCMLWHLNPWHWTMCSDHIIWQKMQQNLVEQHRSHWMLPAFTPNEWYHSCPLVVGKEVNVKLLNLCWSETADTKFFHVFIQLPLTNPPWKHTELVHNTKIKKQQFKERVSLSESGVFLACSTPRG